MKKKTSIVLIVLSIVICATIAVTISYAYWSKTKEQTGSNVVMSKCFDITLTSETDAINLQKAYPISDDAGAKLEPYTFTIKNTCETYASYIVNLEMLSGTTISTEYIAIKVNDKEKAILGGNEGLPIAIKTINDSVESRTIVQGKLGYNKTATYSIRLWLDKDTPLSNETQNKKLKAKIVVEATPEVPPNYRITKASGNTGSDAEIGDTIGITVNGKTENFYVISNVNHKVSALAYYNLNVGENQYKENEVVVNAGIQDEHVLGGKEGFTKYGNVEFSNNTGWNYGENNLEKTYAGPVNTALYDETTGYEKYIQQTIPEATIRLIQKSELEEFGCSRQNEYSGQCGTETIINNHREWIYSTSYMTGSAYNPNYVWIVYAGGLYGGFKDTVNFGVRPVVEFYES